MVLVAVVCCLCAEANALRSVGGAAPARESGHDDFYLACRPPRHPWTVLDLVRQRASSVA